MNANLADKASRILAQDLMMQRVSARLVAASEDTLTLAMTVHDDMVQEHGVCHGGIIFSLADAASGIAAGTHGNASVSQHCTIAYLNPARVGDELMATARRRTGNGRTTIYDVSVINQDGKAIAEFFGISRAVARD